jgi:SulP family sulfate permease
MTRPGWDRFPRRLIPKLVETLPGYTRHAFAADAIAGLTIGLVALPLAMAFAISSGVPPEAGIYTAMIAGFVVSALGGSRCQISGPTGAFVVIVAGIVAAHGIAGLLVCTVMAGILLILMGLTGLGSAVRYIPRSVTIGFTNGIAVLIASTQIKDFLGLSIEQMPGDFLGRMRILADHLGTVDPWSVGLALGTIAIILVWPRVTKRIPGSIVALLACTVVTVFFHVPVETIGTRFGGIPTGLPTFSAPAFQWSLLGELIPSALTVAMLAAIESLLSAVVADSMSGDQHKPDIELIAQGTANVIVPFFGGIPITGAIARTATNIRSGALTPVSGIVHGVVLLIILLVAAPLARHIPLATLAGVLMMVAYNMGEWREIPAVVRCSGADRLVWAATFGLTVFADLTIAVQVGMVLAALLYIRQVSDATSVESITEHTLTDGKAQLLQDKQIPGYITVFRINGPFLFGSQAKLEAIAGRMSYAGSVILLKLHHMPAIDGTGIHALESFAEKVVASGRALLICGAKPKPARMIHRSHLPKIVGQENILPDVDAALQRAALAYDGFGGVGPRMAESLSHRPT